MQAANENGINSIPLFVPILSANMTLEAAVKCCSIEEQNRTEDTRPKNKASVRVHIRNAPDELVSSINLIAKHISKLSKGTTQSILTKCMARHLLCWYKQILHLDNLSDEYELLYEASKKGHSVIRKQLELVNFQFYKASEKIDIRWEVPNFVIGNLEVWSKPLGAAPYQLLIEGMVWSLTTLEHREWDEYNINQHFLPEVMHTAKMIDFRRIDLEGFKKKLEIDR